MIIETESPEPVSLLYYCRPILGNGTDASRHVVTRLEHAGAIAAENPYNSDFHPQTFIVCSEPAFTNYTCNNASFLQGEYDGASGAGLDPCIAFRLRLPPSGEERNTAVIVAAAAATGKGSGCLAGCVHTRRPYPRLIRPAGIGRTFAEA
jgi:hypothetical protein